MREVEVEGGGYYWDKLISAMDGDPDESELLCWGKVGRVLRRIVPHGQEDADPDNDEELHVRPYHKIRQAANVFLQHIPAKFSLNVNVKLKSSLQGLLQAFNHSAA